MGWDALRAISMLRAGRLVMGEGKGFALCWVKVFWGRGECIC